MRRCWMLLGFALLTACGDPLKEVYLVTEPRVLAARVEVEGAPDRASPAPGERVTVRWLVASPRRDPKVGWILYACEAALPGAGLPACQTRPFFEHSAPIPTAGEPLVELLTPADTSASALVVYGAICPGSSPVPSEREPGCEDGAGTRVSADFPLANVALNHNPSIDGSVAFDAVEWPEGSDCAIVPSVTPGSAHTLALELDEVDREALERSSSADPAKETLQVSHFTTAGELDRAFSVIGPEATTLTVRVPWKAPEAPPAGGLVTFYLVVRDLRGGTDWTTRSACVAPRATSEYSHVDARN